jgi:hypothetical protein
LELGGSAAGEIGEIERSLTNELIPTYKCNSDSNKK